MKIKNGKYNNIYYILERDLKDTSKIYTLSFEIKSSEKCPIKFMGVNNGNILNYRFNNSSNSQSYIDDKYKKVKIVFKVQSGITAHGKYNIQWNLENDEVSNTKVTIKDVKLNIRK